MLGRRFTLMVSALVVLFACGGKAGEVETPSASGGSFDGFGGNLSGGTGGFSGSASGGVGAGGTFVDPGCPNQPAPPPRVECDAFGDSSDCPAGFACYPFVDHPFGDGCGVETFGSVCAPAGGGGVGDACGDGTPGCGAGLLCVLGGHAGRHCAQICSFDGKTQCPTALICSRTDIVDVGVCG